MNTGNIQLDVVDLLTVSYQVKTAFGKFVESNILSSVITCRFQTISDDVAWQTFSNLSDVVDFTVDNEDTLLIQFFCKLPEGMTDVIDIFKEIQMVFFYIKDDLKTWIELQEAVEWAKRVCDLGAGEILLTSMDCDGTKAGYDIELTRAVAEAVSVPVIASGGAGTMAHFYDALTEGKADAALAASLFHYKELEIRDLKEYLASRSVSVRL